MITPGLRMTEVHRGSDEPTLAEVVKILLERLERLENRLLTERDSTELLTAHQVDVRYGLRHGTAAAHARAGSVKCRVYRRAARECYKIPLAEAERKWGASLAGRLEPLSSVSMRPRSIR